MSERYRIKATDGLWKFRVERYRGFGLWKTVRRTDHLDRFEGIVREDMMELSEKRNREGMLKNFKPIHAAATWFQASVRDPITLIVTIDTKG